MIPMRQEAAEAQRYVLDMCVELRDAKWRMDTTQVSPFGCSLLTCADPNELARAALESVCYQTCDLLTAMHADWGASRETVLRVDGGMVESDWTMQRLADFLDAPVDRPEVLETTALGAAWLAAMQAGVWPEEAGFAASWRLQRRFEPEMLQPERSRLLAGWHDAVGRTLTKR